MLNPKPGQPSASGSNLGAERAASLESTGISGAAAASAAAAAPAGLPADFFAVQLCPDVYRHLCLLHMSLLVEV